MANRTEITMAPIKGFEDYHIADDGIVYTTKVSSRYNPKGELRVLKPRKHPSGYLYVGMFVGKGPSKQRKWRRVHRLVVETFVGKIPKNKEVNHIDMNKHNNDIDNLEIVTRSQNLLHYHSNKKKLNA